MNDQREELFRFQDLFIKAHEQKSVTGLRKVQKEIKHIRLPFAFLCCLNSEIDRIAAEMTHLEIKYNHQKCDIQ